MSEGRKEGRNSGLQRRCIERDREEQINNYSRTIDILLPAGHRPGKSAILYFLSNTSLPLSW